MTLIFPRATESEQILLGTCMAHEIAPDLSPDSFYGDRHQTVCRIMQDIEQRGLRPDMVTVAERVSAATEGRIASSEVARLGEFVGSLKNLDFHASQIRTAAQLRRAMIQATNFVQQGSEGKADLSQFAADILSLADCRGSHREAPLCQAIKTFLPAMEARIAGGKTQGISTGMDRLDDLTLGLQPGQLIVVAGRPGMGKTAYACQIAVNTARYGFRPVFFSLEMTTDQLIERFLAYLGRVNLHNIRSGKVTTDEHVRLLSASEQLSGLDLVIVDANLNELEILHKSRKLKPHLVIVDYFQLLTTASRTGNRNIDLGEASKAFKLIAKELSIPVIVLSQLSRECEKSNRFPVSSDLRDSGQLEQDADIVLFIAAAAANGHATYDTSVRVRKIICAKHRQGARASWDNVFMGEFQSFDRPARG